MIGVRVSMIVYLGVQQSPETFKLLFSQFLRLKKELAGNGTIAKIWMH
jgi:hypothetical protein